jgi:hypothetical protein
VSFFNINLTLGETMKQLNVIIGSIAAVILSSNTFASNSVIDKALVEAEIAANLNAIKAEITIPKIAETAEIQIDDTVLIAINNTKSEKTTTPSTVEASAE